LTLQKVSENQTKNSSKPKTAAIQAPQSGDLMGGKMKEKEKYKHGIPAISIPPWL
jgi:hypothetical protein